jgi:hypothetical protein
MKVPIGTKVFLWVNSNMRSIRIDGKRIIVENEQRISETEAIVLADTYAVAGDKCKLLKEVKRVVRASEESKGRAQSP